MPQPNTNPGETAVHIEPGLEAITPANEGALAALDAALSGQPPPAPAPVAPVDPKPGDTPPGPDSKPRTPEGDGETDPDDNAPPSDPPKPDDKKTVVPTDPKVDDPKVEPNPEGGMQKRPSDEFGELPKDVKQETRERFETMKTKYDEVARDRDSLAAERDNYKQQTETWVQTVQSTGANPEQFGMALSYLRAVNAGTPEALNEAFEMMLGEIQVIAKHLGKDIPGLVDPLDDFPDLKKRVEDDDSDTPLTRADAIQIAQSRRIQAMRAEVDKTTNTTAAHQTAVNNSLAKVKAFGEEMKAKDPLYAAKTAAIKPMVERVVAHLPPDQWEASVRELYAGAVVAAPAAPPAAPAATDPGIVSPLRPTSTPGAGSGVTKTPGSALEAMDMALKNL